MTHKQKVLALLSDGEPHDHLSLYRLGCVAHSRVADLRKDGHNIVAWREGDRHFYRLVGMLNDPAGVGATKARASSLLAPAGSLSVSQPCGASPATDGAADRGGERGTLILFGKEAA